MEEIPVPMIAHMINFLLSAIVHLLWNRYAVLYLVFLKGLRLVDKDLEFIVFPGIPIQARL